MFISDYSAHDWIILVLRAGRAWRRRPSRRIRARYAGGVCLEEAGRRNAKCKIPLGGSNWGELLSSRYRGEFFVGCWTRLILVML